MRLVEPHLPELKSKLLGQIIQSQTVNQANYKFAAFPNSAPLAHPTNLLPTENRMGERAINPLLDQSAIGHHHQDRTASVAHHCESCDRLPPPGLGMDEESSRAVCKRLHKAAVDRSLIIPQLSPH
jgi:hypothetical protein